MTMTETIINPYVGPRTFERAQSHLFFGREREARNLLARVISQRLTLFYAQSGVGKSSLVNTRLIPQLEQEAGFAVLPVGRISGALPAGVDAVDNIFLFNLMLRLNQAEGDPNRFAHLTLSDFLAHLVSDDGQTFRYVAEATPPPPSQNSELAPYVLIIDQFEEIITTHLDRWPERVLFFQQLNQAMLDDPNLWVVLVLREDYVASLDPFAGLMAERMRARFYMQRMETAAALQAVQQPAKLGGRPFAPGVAEALVDNLRRIKVLEQVGDQLGQYVEPVQLQVVCYQLWENLYEERGKEKGAGSRGTEDRGAEDSDQPPLSNLQSPRTDNYITETDLKALAGDKGLADFVNQALGDYYEQAIAKVLQLPELNVNERELRDWFTDKLITQEETRGLVHQGEVDTGGLPNVAVHLMEQQFLIHAESRAGGLWYELVHDRFVQPILQANRDWLLAQSNPVTVALRLWKENNRDSARLLRGAQLADAQHYANAHPRELGEDERDFLAASARQREIEAEAERQRELAQARALASEQERTATRFRRFTAGLVVLVFLVLGATGVAIRGQQETERFKNQIRADQLAQKALLANLDTSLEHFPQQALLLDVEAADVVSPTLPSVLTSLHDLLGHTGGQPGAGHADAVWSVAFSPDGKHLASASGDRTIRLWQLDQPNAASVVLRGHTDVVWSVAFSPDGKHLASASDDRTIRVWQLDQLNAASVVLRGHTAAVRSVAFSPDGKHLATAGDDKTIRVWSLDQLNADPVVLRSYSTGVESVAFSPDGHRLATANDDWTIRVWSLDQPNAAPVVLRGHAAPVWSVAFSPDGKHLASASGDQTIRLWQLDQPNADPVVLLGHTAAVRSVAFSPDGNRLASASNDKTIRVWSLDQTNAAPVVLRGHEALVVAVAFSPDGKHLASASNDKTIRVWSLDQPNADPVVLRAHTAAVWSVAFSPDGKHLATASDDKTIRVWSLDQLNADPIVSLSYAAAVWSVVFSPDGKHLATANDDWTIHVWSLDQPNAAPIVLRSHADAVWSVAFSPDGKHLASASGDQTIRLWQLDQPNANPVVLLGHTAAVRSVAFSPDGKHLASASDDRTIRVWSLDQPNADPIILRGHTAAVYGVVFSPDGKHLASASDDQTILVWSLDQLNADPVILRGHTAAVRSIAFSPDGKRLASASDDQTVRLWLPNTGALIALACATAGRNLSRNEWLRYFPGEPYRRTCPQWPDGEGIVNGTLPTSP